MTPGDGHEMSHERGGPAAGHVHITVAVEESSSHDVLAGCVSLLNAKEQLF